MDTKKMLIELYETNWLKKHCLYVTKNNYLADYLMSSITISILEKDNPKLIKLYLEKNHYKYINKMIKNEYINKFSELNKYIRNNQYIEEIIINNKNNDDDE